MRAYAQQYTEKAIEALAEIMESGESEAARVSAANALLDRGHGKATITLGDGDGKTVDLAAILVAGRERLGSN